jgi:hypothetical protein
MAFLYKTIRECFTGSDTYIINNGQIFMTGALPYKAKPRIDFYIKYDL